MKYVPELIATALMEQSLMDAKHVLGLLEISNKYNPVCDTDLRATKRLVFLLESRIQLIKDSSWTPLFNDNSKEIA